ncbi:S-layer homology domain-containing protein [Solibacillus sp. FSL R5-0449]|uniref:S-layer homology domain-containing protein n=1 Tax=Solibacillus sp. FSL R5-0449 TaxID=2921639 RepID=UPI0030CA7DF8
MDSKKAQKLSKAAVATVLATSGVLVAIPHQANAYSFSDLNPNADYYEPIIDLANRKIATGYSNGTFKPNAAITREDAAKMLALTIDVNITNPKNPGFKDVTVNNPNYRYIAALAEAGVINGYSDKTFKPKEPITRGQMAKILTLGFKFGVSTKLNHGFKDVSNKNANAYFIQTLYDLNITKGKTPVSFDPFNTVTRGQMATFIWRAEKADRGNPVYVVGDIVGNQIYINGVAYTVASHLRSIINAGNQNVLKGAYIEGSYSGKTLQNISKLTINASGNSSRLLALDGGYSSFAGELVVHGSYVRFKNINFTGRVEVAEAPRRSLGALENVRIASIGNFASFIDWGTPTDPKNEDFLNPVDKETLQDKPDPTKPEHLQKYTERMANIKKYVDFENADIRQLYVTADRTFLKANYDIDRLTVQGNVANIELYASPKAMYIDTDYNVSIYGVHDIQYVYKNTLKNVHLNTDSTYDFYYITSSNGFTNLGTHAYISKAIIPKNKTVNDVFDDYKTDDPNIGYVEDEDGKAVDRDPVENTIVTDVTSPTITQLDVEAGGSTADVTLTADEDGTYYYVIKKANEKAPTISEIKTGGTKYNGNGPLVMDEPVKFTVSGLETMTDYVIYAIVIDDADNVSEKEEQEFSTIDNRPPTFRLDKGETMYGGKRVQFVIKGITEPGEYYYYIREKSPVTMPDPTVDEIMKRYTGKGTITKPDDVVITETKYGATPAIGDIKPNTEYEIYAVMVDKSGNKMRNPAPKITLKTEAPDTTYPYVINTELTPVSSSNSNEGYFYISVSEELDKASAENVNNYVLSGTGIVNITGQKEIKPSEVIYSDKRIRIKIPSVTALVNGDTIRATVLPGVKDLAENEFESALTAPGGNPPRNYAVYNHTDALAPKLKIDKVESSPTDNKFLIDVTTNKAGTYYYMILENGYFDDKDTITPRDFVDEFDSETVTGKFQTDSLNDYLAKGTGPAELGKITLPPISRPSGISEFKDYSIYILLKDRSGKISVWDQKTLITDTKPPLTSNYIIQSPITGIDRYKNETALITFNSDEDGTLHVAAIPKYRKDPNNTNTYIWNTDSKGADYFNHTTKGLLETRSEIKNINNTSFDNKTRLQYFTSFANQAGLYKKEGFKAGNPTVEITNLDPHMEYSFLIGVEDVYGNFTIREVDNDTPPISTDEPNGKLIVKDFYTDGVKPYLTNSVIYRKGDPLETNTAEFTITFNESIMRQNDVSKFNKSSIIPGFDLSKIMKITDNSSDNITDQFSVKSYTPGTSTGSQSTLVITTSTAVSSTASDTIRVTMLENNEDAYDYVDKNAFNLDVIGKYYWPGKIKNEYWGAELVNPSILNGRKYSKKLEVGVGFGVVIGRDNDLDLTINQTLYYATLVNKTKVTSEEIFAAYRGYTVSGIQTVQTKTLTAKDIAGVIELTLPENENDTAVFREDDHIAAFTIDDFGNIVWLYENSNNYIKIK